MPTPEDLRKAASEITHRKFSESGVLPDVIDHEVKVRIHVGKFVLVHPITGEEIDIAPELSEEKPKSEE